MEGGRWIKPEVMVQVRSIKRSLEIWSNKRRGLHSPRLVIVFGRHCPPKSNWSTLIRRMRPTNALVGLPLSLFPVLTSSRWFCAAPTRHGTPKGRMWRSPNQRVLHPEKRTGGNTGPSGQVKRKGWWTRRKEEGRLCVISESPVLTQIF